MRWLVVVLALTVLGVACARRGRAADVEEGNYPFDLWSRAIVPGQPLACEQGRVELVSYAGERVRYAKPVRVHPSFRTHLRAFEQIVAEVSRAHYGRPPRSIVHFGAYACRPMRGRSYWASEHAFGNAIDVAGFEFGPLRKAGAAPALPAPLRRAFGVRVDKHWNAAGAQAPHAAFLRDLADRLVARPEVFRSVIGPGAPLHDNHFHLANAPYRIVQIGEVRRWMWW